MTCASVLLDKLKWANQFAMRLEESTDFSEEAHLMTLEH